MKICDFKAFTLAEVMIVLTVIGVLTAILLPVARQSMPDENLMKFKKAHNTLLIVIRELVTSDKYYKDGDLGIRADGNPVDSATYFCETIANIINTKSVNCVDRIESDYKYVVLCQYNGNPICTPSIEISTSKTYLDNACRKNFAYAKQIEMSDNIIFYDPVPQYHFGLGGGNEDAPSQTTLGKDNRIFSSVNHDGFDRLFKYFCIDIDGVHPQATESDCVNECPFGYGISVYGKIMLGTRAEQWLERETLEE